MRQLLAQDAAGRLDQPYGRRHNMPPPEPKEREVLLNYLETAYPPRARGRGGWQNPFSK
jgi:hypothetical protein